MLPEKTYILRFTLSGSSEIEELEHTNESDAREHFALFGIEDADTYSRIELVERDWAADEDTLLEALELDAAETIEANTDWYEDEYIPSSTAGDYGPSNPWDAPGMSISDFI